MKIDLFIYQSLSLKIELLREEPALLDLLSDYWILSSDSHNVWNIVWKQIYIEKNARKAWVKDECHSTLW